MVIYSSLTKNLNFIYLLISTHCMWNAFHLIYIWWTFRVECGGTKFAKSFCLHVRIHWQRMQIGFTASKRYQKKGFRHIARHHLEGHFTKLIAPHRSSIRCEESLVPQDVVIAFNYKNQNKLRQICFSIPYFEKISVNSFAVAGAGSDLSWPLHFINPE